MNIAKIKNEITGDRMKVLSPLIDYIQSKLDKGMSINLQFICTHNSRRSQFAQIWAKVAAEHFGVSINSLSGGTEVTEFNKRVGESLSRMGFQVNSTGGINPKWDITWNGDPGIQCFSKLYNDSSNQVANFAAVMTCSHAEENCPFVPGTEKRIALNYSDPKEFDGTDLEAQKYDERSIQIASEMYYVFSQIKK